MHRPPLTVESASIDYGAARALAARVAATGDAGNAAPAADGAENLPPLLNAGTAGAAGALLARVLEAAAELECRCVGRNADDAAAVRNGLVALAAHVGALERRLDKAPPPPSAGLAAALEAARADADRARAAASAAEAEANQMRARLDAAASAAAAAAAAAADRVSPPPCGDAAIAAAAAGSRASPDAAATSGSDGKGPFVVSGAPRVGSALSIATVRGGAPSGGVQWVKRAPGTPDWTPIPGAVKAAYSPEPADAGSRLAVRVRVRGEGSALVAAPTAVAPDAGSDAAAACLAAAGGGDFACVVVSPRAGDAAPLIHTLVLDTGGSGLRSPTGAWTARAEWHAGMAACGGRGAGAGAPQSLFFDFGGHGTAVLVALESPRARNTALVLARALAEGAGVPLATPAGGPATPRAGGGHALSF